MHESLHLFIIQNIQTNSNEYIHYPSNNLNIIATRFRNISGTGKKQTKLVLYKSGYHVYGTYFWQQFEWIAPGSAPVPSPRAFRQIRAPGRPKRHPNRLKSNN